MLSVRFLALASFIKVYNSPCFTIMSSPYDLAQLAIYDASGVFIETTSASKQVTAQVPTVPAESAAKPAQVSAAARAYFTRLREQHHAALRDRTQTSFTRFQSTDDDNNNKEHRDADA